MLQIRECTNKDQYQQIWSANNLHILQSWQWGEVKKDDFQIVRLELFDDQKPIYVFSLQITSKPIIGKFAYLGKVRNISEQSIVALKEYVTKELHLAFVILELDEDMALVDERRLEWLVKMPNSPVYVQPPYSNRVDLSKEIPLDQRIDAKYRRNINKARRENIIVEHTHDPSSEIIDAFTNVMQDIFHNTNLKTRDVSYYYKVYRELATISGAEVFVARTNNEVLGSYLTVSDDLGAYELYGGVNMLGRKGEAGYILKYEAMQYYQSLGKSFYDHWGVAKFDQTGNYDTKHPLYRISQFKKGFGGNNIHFIPTKLIAINQLKTIIFKVFGKFRTIV